MNTFRLDTPLQTLVIAVTDGVPEALYWGPPLPEGEDLAQFAASTRSDLTGGMLDALPPLSLSPEAARSFPGAPGLIAAAADGTPLTAAFAFARAEETLTTLTLISTSTGTANTLTLAHHFATHPTGTITLRTTLAATTPIRVHWLAAPVLPGPRSGDILDLSGKWTREFQPQRTPWSPGQRVREAQGGRSGHENPPFALFPSTGCTNTQGTAHGLSYAWSGGHRMLAEELPDGRRQIQFGHLPGSETAPGLHFETADLIACVSTTGLNGIATTFQCDTGDRIVQWPDADRPRPVHYNCWEAVYFRHDAAILTDIATRAAALGAERFVLDDGWFGRRDDDTTSLGDWTVDRRKWPDGLHPLIAHVHAQGMTFGLWVEPEMVNPVSDFHDAHPDWALGPKDQTLGRHQMVLNLALPAVQDYLFAAIDALLAEYPVDYLKWDHNRLPPVADAAQARALYALLARLRAAHPSVEIESCASGGGRIDAGILAHTHRVWLSDSNDALERLAIQHQAALFLPAAVTGSHVGPRHCHTSGRDLPMAFRARVAAQRHMGFEMDPRELTEVEAQTLTAVTTWWKANRNWMLAGTIHRLDSPDPAVTAELQLAADGSRFIVFSGQSLTSAQILPRPLPLTALDPAARYEVTLLNPEDAARHSRGPNALKSGPVTLTGAALMQHGVTFPVAWPATLWMLEGRRIP